MQEEEWNAWKRARPGREHTLRGSESVPGERKGCVESGPDRKEARDAEKPKIRKMAQREKIRALKNRLLLLAAAC